MGVFQWLNISLKKKKTGEREGIRKRTRKR